MCWNCFIDCMYLKCGKSSEKQGANSYIAVPSLILAFTIGQMVLRLLRIDLKPKKTTVLNHVL